MAKKKSASKKKQTRTAGKRPNAARPSGQKRTGMDRFAVPAGTQTERQAARAPAAPAPSGQTERKPSARRQSAGMQVQVGDPGRRMRPQKAAVTTRQAGGPVPSDPRSQAARSQRLRRIVRRKDRRARLTKVFAALLTAACSLFALTAFFQIDAIEFRGLTRYKAADVLATFGVKTGENMFFCDSWRGARRVKAAYPYFSDVRVTRTLPDKLILNVTEAVPAAAVNGKQGGWFILDRDARVLEKTNEQAASGIAEVLGLDTAGAAPSQPLTVEQPEVLSDLKALMAALDENGFLDKVQLYNLKNRERIWFQYDGRYAVCVGEAKDLAQKLAMLRELMDQELFSPSDKGTIDLSKAGQAVTDMSLTTAQVRRTARGEATLQHVGADEEDETGETDGEGTS